MMLSTHFPVHLTGDSFYALGLGLMQPSTYRYIEEYVPQKLLSATFAGVTVLGSVAHLMSELSVEILPSDDDTEAIRTNNTWRICEGMPIVFFLLTFLGLFTLIRHDSPRFYLYSTDK